MTTRSAGLRHGRGLRLLAGLVLLAGVITLIVGGLGRVRVDTGIDEFVPPGDLATKALGEVASSFGGDPVVLLIETRRPGELFAADRLPRLLALEGKLSRLPDVASVYGPATVLNQIAGQAQDFLAELTGYRDAVRARGGERAVQRFDRRYGSLLAQGIPGGLPTLHNEKFVRNAVFSQGFEPRPQWHFVVPQPDSVAVLVRPRQELDQAAAEELVAAVRAAADDAQLGAQRVTVSGAPAVVAALGAQVRHEIPVLGGIALVLVGGWFLLLRWTRRRHRLVPLLTTIAATALTFALFGWLGLPVSFGAVAFLPILLGVGSDFMTYLHRRVGRRTVAAVALATAASFGALAVTPIPAVRELGLTLAAGIVLALVVAYLMARWLPDTGDRVSPARRQRAARPLSRRKRVLTGAVAGLLGAAGWLLLPTMPLRADFDSFAADLAALTEARHVEQVMGSSGEVVVALTGKDVVTRESLQWMRSAEQSIVTSLGDQVRPILSPPSLLRFLGSAPTSSQLEAALRLTPRYLTSSVIRSDHGMAMMSFGVRLHDADELRVLRDDIRRSLPSPPAGAAVRVTGLPVLAVAAHDTVSEGRYLANAMGILAAGLVLAACLRRRLDALRAVAAATLATGLGLLAMWLLGIALTPLTVAVGSLTAAVGCEFTVVLAEAARRRGQDEAGIRRAVLLAAAASATGYAVLMFSGLVLVREFGALLAAAVAVAWASAALVVWLTTRRDPCSTAGGLPAAVAETRRERADARQPV